MNTPAHILVATALFGRAGDSRLIWAAALGAIAPDASLYLMVGISLFILSIPPETVFDELYFSNAWQTVFAIDNSAFLWCGLFALALWRKWAVISAFAGAGVLHLALDFPLHAGDGRPHFWPLSDWVFVSPISYWDSQYHAGWVAPLTVVICVLSYVALWRKPVSRWAMLVFSALLIAEIWVIRQWILFF